MHLGSDPAAGPHCIRVSLVTVWSTATALGEFTVCLVLLPCHSHSQSFSKRRLNAGRGFHLYQSTPFSLQIVEWVDVPHII